MVFMSGNSNLSNSSKQNPFEKYTSESPGPNLNEQSGPNSSPNEQNSSPTEGELPKLTQRESFVVNLINQGVIDNKVIAKEVKTGIRNIQKVVQNLKKKGAIGISSPIVRQSDRSGEQSGIRLHAEQFLIKPLWKAERYAGKIGKAIQIENNTILIEKDIIQYYCNYSFFGSDSYAATAKSFNYHNKIFKILENDLGCVIIKSRSQNIERVKSEYAQINNGLAKKVENEGQRIRLRTTDEGKVWFEIDNSWNLHEAETKGKTAHRDMQKVVEPLFNDMRDKDFYLMSDTKSMIDKLAIVSSNIVQSQLSTDSMFQRTNESVNWLAENIKSHGPVLF